MSDTRIVVSHGKNPKMWVLAVDGAESILSSHRTQIEAVAAAIEILSTSIGGELIINRVDGTTRSRHTIGRLDLLR